MSTERWIVLCAIFAVAAFFAGTLYGEAMSRPIVDSQVNQVRELEYLANSLERRELVLITELGRTPDLPAKHVPAGGRVSRE